MRGRSKKKTGSRGRKILSGLRSLVKLSRMAGFEVSWIKERNGHCYYWTKKIEIGKNFSNTEKLVVMAHELGHVLDYSENFPVIDELVHIVKFWDNYEVGDVYYEREKRAWDYAKFLLEQIDVLKTVNSSFYRYKNKVLRAYRLRKEAAKLNGMDKPNQEELKKACSDVNRSFGKGFLKLFKTESISVGVNHGAGIRLNYTSC